jgi:hypothetical protein
MTEPLWFQQLSAAACEASKRTNKNIRMFVILSEECSEQLHLSGSYLKLVYDLPLVHLYDGFSLRCGYWLGASGPTTAFL